jgi:hypothetical protein
MNNGEVASGEGKRCSKKELDQKAHPYFLERLLKGYVQRYQTGEGDFNSYMEKTL